MIPIVLCIDVEPDGPGHLDPPAGPWAGFVGMHRWLAGLRGSIEDRTGHPAVFTWFLRMDPQVTEVSGSVRHGVDAHPAAMAGILERGDPLGLHVHGWRRLPDHGWVDDFSDHPWLAHCIDSSYEAFTEALGTSCRLSRMGGRFLDDWTAGHLRGLGTVVDLSLEAANSLIPSGTRPTIDGDLPDCRRTPRAPHRLGSGLIELPLSASTRPKGWHPRRHLSRMKHHGIRERLDLPVQMARNTGPHDTFGAQVERAIRAQRRPYLAYALRSDGLLTPEKARRIETQMEELVEVAARRGGAFVGPEEALAALDFP